MLPLLTDTVVEGSNTIGFRFNGTNGVASGFRVVAFNLLTGDSSKVLEPDVFTEEDPNTWVPPLRDSESIKAGHELWSHVQLRANALQNAPLIQARCSDCHAYDGRDLKYFGFSNASIAARSRFHGLSDLQGQQIASYIRSLNVPSPGRPWNPPYQPGPGLDAQPTANWAAGAGLAWALDSDIATIRFIFAPNGDEGMECDHTRNDAQCLSARWKPESSRDPHFPSTARLEPLASACASPRCLGFGFSEK